MPTIADLEDAKREQNRCMGGVDPEGCVAAARRVVEIRAALRNNAALIEHLAICLTTPLSAGRGNRSGRSSR